jgi:hypothetical protein
MGEVGKFFRLAANRRINGEATGREAILVKFADGAEIRGAEKGDPVMALPVEGLALDLRMFLIEPSGPVFLKTEPGKACAFRQFSGR